jgi:alpha-tubulin suppressor-like RCC1 family protein
LTLTTNSTNNLFTWGSNDSGQLGCNNLELELDFTDLGNQLVEKEYLIDVYPNLVPWMKAPSLWMWGCNNTGQLGTNSTINQSSPVQTISAGSQWKTISSGRFSSASIKTDGTLWLWGCGLCGRLGNNSTINRSSPVQTVSNVATWKQVSLGDEFVGAIKTDGTLWLWGDAANGVLGNNSTIDRSSPVQTVSNVATWKQVSVSGTHSAAVKTDGTLWLWGSGGNGRLGNNSTINQSSPVQTVSNVATWKQVSLGSGFSAASKTDGTLWLWGNGANGRLGNNSTLDQSSPVQTITTGTNWKQVSTSSAAGTSAVIKTDGTLWLWGFNGSGELGNNSTIDQSSPVQTVSTGNNWKQVGLPSGPAGGATASIKTDGTLWLWGCNNAGQLGNNSTTNVSSPAQTIIGGQSWKDVCGSMAIYEVYDW